MDDPWGSPWADEAPFAPPDEKHVLNNPALVEEPSRKNEGSIWDADGSYGIWDHPDPVGEDKPQLSVLTGFNGGGGSDKDFGWDSTTPKASEFQGGMIDSQLSVEESRNHEQNLEPSMDVQDINIAESGISSAKIGGTEPQKDIDFTATSSVVDEDITKESVDSFGKLASTDSILEEVNIGAELLDDSAVVPDDNKAVQESEVGRRGSEPSDPSTSKRSSSVSSHNGHNDIAVSSKTSFELETSPTIETPTGSSGIQEQNASSPELEKSSIDLPSSGDGHLSTAETASPSKPSDEQSELDDTDFGDFEEEVSDTPLDSIDNEESKTTDADPVEDRGIHHGDISSREPPMFAISYSSVSELFNNKNVVPADPAKDSELINDFSSVVQRKTWYRISRYGSIQKHNLGNDENYTRIKWPSSKIRDETLKIVARWMNEGRMGGAHALIGTGHAGSGTLFGWGESGTNTPIDMASIWASRRSSPQPPASKSTTPTNPKPSTPQINSFLSPPTHSMVGAEMARSDKSTSSSRQSHDDSQFAWSTPNVDKPISKSLGPGHLPATDQSPILPIPKPSDVSQPPLRAKSPLSPQILAPKAFPVPKPNSLLQQAASKRISLNLPPKSSPTMGHRSTTSMVNVPHTARNHETTVAPLVEAKPTGSKELEGLGLTFSSEAAKAPAEQVAEIVPNAYSTPEQKGVCKFEEDDDDEWGEMVESAPPTPADFKFPPSPTFAWSISATKDTTVSQSNPTSQQSQDAFLKQSIKSHKPSMSLAVPFSPPPYTPPSPTLAPPLSPTHLQPNSDFRGHKPSLSVGGKPSSPEHRFSRSLVDNRQDTSSSYAMPVPAMAQPDNFFNGHRPSMSVGGARPLPPKRRVSRSPVDLRYGGSTDFDLFSPNTLVPDSNRAHRTSMSVGGISPFPDRQLSRSPVDRRYGALQSEVDTIMNSSSQTNHRTSTPIGSVSEGSLIDMSDELPPPRPPPNQLIAIMEARRNHKYSASMGFQAHPGSEPPPGMGARRGHRPARSFDEILSPTHSGPSPLPSLSTTGLYSPSFASPTSPATKIQTGDFSVLNGLGDLPDNIAEHLSPVAESTSPIRWNRKTQAEEVQEQGDEIARRIIGGLPNFAYMLRRR